MNLNDRRLDILAMCYAYTGCFIFLLGWIRPVFAIPAAGLTAAALVFYAMDLKRLPEREKLMISPVSALLVFVAVCVWSVISGYGAFVEQAGDWNKHNMVLNDLVTHSWPVYYLNSGRPSMLSYYIGQYLVPALAGKMATSFRIAEIAMLIWNIPGIYLAALLLLRAVKADTGGKQALTIGVFFFFGTLLFLSQALYGFAAIGSDDLSGNSHWISESIRLQYPYNWSHVRWAFAQTIVPWIVTLLFVDEEKRYGHYAFLAAPLLFHASLPFLGLFALMAGRFLWDVAVHGQLVRRIREAVSLPNICSIFGCMLITLIYLWDNVTAPKPESISLGSVDYGSMPVLYYCFIASFLCYSVAIFQEYRETPLFYLVNLLLCALPFFTVGAWNDLVMRSSMPCTLILMVFIIKALFFYRGKPEKRKKMAALLIMLAVGAYYPVYETVELLKDPAHYNLQGVNDPDSVESLEIWANPEDEKVDAIASHGYYVYEYEDKIFKKYFAKQ